MSNTQKKINHGIKLSTTEIKEYIDEIVSKNKIVQVQQGMNRTSIPGAGFLQQYDLHSS